MIKKVFVIVIFFFCFLALTIFSNGMVAYAYSSEEIIDNNTQELIKEEIESFAV